MGCLVGIPHFFTQTALDEEKSDASSLRQARGGESDGAAAKGDSDLVECQMSIVYQMQTQFQGRVLRRTTDSKNCLGKALIDIPPYEEMRLIVKPTD
jgi:hypothetical protein